MSHKSREHFDSYEKGFLSTSFGSPSGEICWTAVRLCDTEGYVCCWVFFVCVPGDWTKDKEALTQNFQSAVQHATTQALTNLF